MPEKKSVAKTKGDDRIYVNGVPLHMKGVLVVNPEPGDGHVKHVGGGRFQGLHDIHGICYNKQRCILIYV